jgi:hypothetical protein
MSRIQFWINHLDIWILLKDSLTASADVDIAGSNSEGNHVTIGSPCPLNVPSHATTDPSFIACPPPGAFRSLGFLIVDARHLALHLTSSISDIDSSSLPADHNTLHHTPRYR